MPIITITRKNIYEAVQTIAMSFEAPFLQIHYTEGMHPRKDGYVKPYWLRIRSNPYRRNYH